MTPGIKVLLNFEHEDPIAVAMLVSILRVVMICGGRGVRERGGREKE